ncbi:MAG: hypothetical protein LWW85_08875 [Marinilabiliales bacterium]|nr:hypothetical protein [Marinilabiliales bacterium]
MPVFFQVQTIGGAEITGLIHNQEILLPIKDVFDFLKIKNSLSSDMDTLTGFFLSTDAKFVINHGKHIIKFLNKSYPIPDNKLIRTETNLYLHSSLFGSIFGLDCRFNVRSLSVNMSTKLELPVMREIRLEQIRQNVNRIQGNYKVDTVLVRGKPGFHFGMADWSLIATDEIGKQSDARINLNLGANIAGGDAAFYLNYDTKEVFSEKQQYYHLGFVNNDNKWLRQSLFGKISTESVSSIYSPVIGFKLTNSPTTYRTAFGTYPISDYTHPGWMVELYVNNVLVDYKKADASGFYSFQVPLVYGSSNIKLRFYGPWGEEQTKEQSFSVPYNFLPKNELEYSVSGGIVEDGMQSLIAKAKLDYGLTKNITIGTGLEFLSSVTTGTTMPFVNLSARILPAWVVSGEYMYGVRFKGITTYQLPGNMEIEADYTKYKEGQKAVNFNYLEERKFIVTVPLKGRSMSIYNRVTFDQIKLPISGYSTAEWLLSGSFLGMNTNLTNYAMFANSNQPYLYSNLALSLRLPKNFTFIPQAQYEISHNRLVALKAGVEKYFFGNGFFSVSFENNLASNMQSIQFGVRYDFRSVQTSMTSRISNNGTTVMGSARGSLVVDPENHYVGTTNRSEVGKGGIVFAPFLDLNCNNKMDPGEPKVVGLDVRMTGGLVKVNDRDSTIRVTSVEPFTPHLAEVENNFENIAWKIRNKSFSVTVEPNVYRRIDIPVWVVGEVTGTISEEKNGSSGGIGRMLLLIYDREGKLVGKTLTEPDGYYSYLGLKPGNYRIAIDPSQLNKLNFKASPGEYPFTIKTDSNGDIVEGVDFVVKKK